MEVTFTGAGPGYDRHCLRLFGHWCNPSETGRQVIIVGDRSQSGIQVKEWDPGRYVTTIGDCETGDKSVDMLQE